VGNANERKRWFTALDPFLARITSPVNQPESSEARNTATFVMSEGGPIRPSGVIATSCCTNLLPTPYKTSRLGALPQNRAGVEGVHLDPSRRLASTRMAVSRAVLLAA
jgi:hypothetical protein